MLMHLLTRPTNVEEGEGAVGFGFLVTSSLLERTIGLVGFSAQPAQPHV